MLKAYVAAMQKLEDDLEKIKKELKDGHLEIETTMDENLKLKVNICHATDYVCCLLLNCSLTSVYIVCYLLLNYS